MRRINLQVLLPVLVLALALVPCTQGNAQESPEGHQTHGTINILLSNGAELVVVADRRLTWKGEHGKSYTDDAQKGNNILGKVD